MIQLHNHTTYSFLDGYGLPEQIISRCKELGEPAIAITDHGNCLGHYAFYKEAKKQGINPLLGIEAYFVPDRKVCEPKERRYHMTLIAKNNEGYSNLMQMVSEAAISGFYYKARVDWELLERFGDGIICLSGCPNGLIHKHLQDGEAAYVKMDLERLKRIFGEDFYIELMHTKYMDKRDELYDLAEETGTEMVLTCDCHYPKLEHEPAQEIMMCIGSRRTMDDPERWHYEEPIFYQMTDEEAKAQLKKYSNKDFSKAIANTYKIAEKCNVELKVEGRVTFPYDGDKKKLFLDAIEVGKGKRKMPDTDEYNERLAREIDIIVKKDYVDYFLITWDMIKWAKDEGIFVGPARGSAAGSLVSYLMEITEVDPMKFGLIFERFIDINRMDPPDIDTDFEDDRRHEVKEYLARTYGEKRVATLATYSTMKGKVCFTDIGRIFKIPFEEVETLKSLLVERSGGDSRASFTVEDTIQQFPKAKEVVEKHPQFNFAATLEGQYRQMSSHAAGVIVGNVDLDKHFTLTKVRGEMILGADKKTAEKRGFLKMDILGIKYLSFLSRVRKTIKIKYGNWVDYYSLPLDDQKVYETFQTGKLFGIFQFEGFAVGSIAKQMMPKDFEEITHINALSRPGCLNAGATTRFLDRKSGSLPMPKKNPIYAELTKDTYGEIIYQEQVMMAMRNIGLMSWEDTAEIRKLISKSQGEEKFNTFKDRFMDGGMRNGYPEEDLEEIWNNVCTFGSWAFNKSHSVSYSLLAYWGMYIKTYYPMEFYCEFCRLEKDSEKLNKIVRELQKEGIKFELPEINSSGESFRIKGKDAITAGFKDLKGIGETTAKKIVIGQPYKDFEDFKKRTKLGAGIIEKLRKGSAFRELGMERAQMSLFDDPDESHMPTPEEMVEVMPYGVSLGIYERYAKACKQLYPKYELTTLDTLQSKGRRRVCLPVIIKERNLRDINEIGNMRIKADAYTDYDREHLNEFMNFIMEDDTEYSFATLNRKKYPEFKNEIWSNLSKTAVYAVAGNVVEDKQMIFLDSLTCLTPAKND